MIAGIYSFPKSGNTWIREFIHSLYVNYRVEENIVPDFDLSQGLGPEVMSPNAESWCFYKSHSHCEINVGEPNDLIIYVLRNPLDVFCSQLNYVLLDLSKQGEALNLVCADVDDAHAKSLIKHFFGAFMVFGTLMPTFGVAGGWGKHVSYWINRSFVDSRIVVLRYEDLLSDFHKFTDRITDRLGFNHQKVEEALCSANERCNDGGKFYWKKSSSNYLNYLSDELINEYVCNNIELLKFTGYDKLISIN